MISAHPVELGLPVGRYRLTVERWKEYLPSMCEVNMRGGSTEMLRCPRSSGPIWRHRGGVAFRRYSRPSVGCGFAEPCFGGRFKRGLATGFLGCRVRRDVGSKFTDSIRAGWR